MSGKIYPIGIQNFEKFVKVAIFILIKQHWFINW